MQNSRPGPPGILILIPILFGSWLLLTSLTEIVPGLGLFDGKRITQLYLISLCLSLVLFSAAARQKFADIVCAIPRWVRILILIFFALGLISSLRTNHPAYPLLDVAMLFLLVVTTISVACSAIRSDFYFDRLVLVLIAMMGLGVVVQDLMGLLVYLSTDQQFSYLEALIRFIHPRLYNQVQTWTIPLLALLPLLFKNTRWMGILSMFLIGAQWYILLSTGARGSSISLLLAMALVGIILPGTRKYWFRVHVWGLVLGLAFYFSVVGLLEVAQPDKSDFVRQSIGRPMLHTSGRTDLWKHAIEDAVENPWLGAGPMRYACGVKHYMAGSPHSFPLQIMAEWGIPAFGVLGAIFTWLLYSWVHAARSIRAKPGYEQALTGCLSITFLAAIIHVCVSGLLIAPSSQVAAMLVMGFLLGNLVRQSSGPQGSSPRSGSASTPSRIGKYTATLLLALAFLTSVSVLVFSTTELDQLAFRTSYAQDYGPITPRFWQDGRFCEFSF